MTRLTPFVLLAASAALLAACSAPAPVAAPGPAPAPDDPADDQSRAIHGSTLTMPPPGTANVCVAPDARSNGVVIWPACDNLTTDRMGYWNPVAVDPNNNSNTNYNKDYHLMLALNNFAPGVTASKITIANGTGAVWDSFGYPNHEFLGVYAADNSTLLLKSGQDGQALPISGTPVFNLYMDAPEATTNPLLKAGATVTVTVTTSVGDSVWPNLKL